ncbi:hypothetical protein AB0K48_58925, partial [Nonomuraea sp. NPDC055795]
MDFGLISGPELNFWAGVAGRWVWPGISGAIELLISPERQAELQDPGRRASRNADADCILTPFACGVGCGVEFAAVLALSGFTSATATQAAAQTATQAGQTEP